MADHHPSASGRTRLPKRQDHAVIAFPALAESVDRIDPQVMHQGGQEMLDIRSPYGDRREAGESHHTPGVLHESGRKRRAAVSDPMNRRVAA
jgi:hypothetical protein